ncbi:hypothetical protein FB451DRAFT_1409066 [Mycena latifolia]|nr:hypothetical protein FB451DRAFT_1409066 [Mycena latifolia]
MESIVMTLPTDSLLPNVQRISPTPFHYLRFFIGPKLHSLTIDPETFASLSISGWRRSNVQLSAFVLELNHLQTLVVGCLDQLACRHLAGLPGLESLDILRLDRDSMVFPNSIPHQSSLSALQHISLRGLFAANFMTMLGISPLQTVLQPFPSFLNIIIVHFWAQDDGPAHTMTSVELRPLLKFTSLSHLSLLPPYGFSVGDEFVDAMTLAWPQIEHLDIGAGRETMPSIMTLFSFKCRSTMPHEHHG